MYSFKEKKLHMINLHNPDAAHIDLDLLKSIDPTHKSLKSFARNPSKNASDILLALLDVISREEIRDNRRSVALEEEKKNTPAPVAGNEAGNNAGNEAGNDATELKEKVQELKEKVEEAEDRADEAKEKVEELEEKVDELEEKIEETEAALEEEKKKIEEKPKQPAKSSPKKTSTPKSTGKTSQTKTSKQPQ